MKMELKEWDSLEGSAHTPMYNPHILPLNTDYFSATITVSEGSASAKYLMNKEFEHTSGYWETSLKKDM